MPRFNRLLITGAAGKLGRELRRGLAPLARIVRITDRDDMGPVAENEEAMTCELGDFDGVMKVVEGCDSMVTTTTLLNPSYSVEIEEQSCVPADTGVTVWPHLVVGTLVGAQLAYLVGSLQRQFFENSLVALHFSNHVRVGWIGICRNHFDFNRGELVVIVPYNVMNCRVIAIHASLDASAAVHGLVVNLVVMSAHYERKLVREDLHEFSVIIHTLMRQWNDQVKI